jgi:anaerobic magnesium-protoporphyrin IX monomethyl ester cyclase
MATQNNYPIDALLVGYENQENIGLRSIIAYLSTQGFKAILVPFLPGRHDEMLAAVQQFQPRLIGFSLIFQYTLDEFGKLMCYLRDNGVQAHFTAGGHFPSLRPEETLQLLPVLDSIVRFEGELTLAALLRSLEQPDQWACIQGLAFRRGHEVMVTSLRPLVADLDSLPPIYRDTPRMSSAGVRIASMLASRGCLFNCSFCSIRQFYGSASGALRRSRSPQAVVDEMYTLFTEDNVRLFMFQDDDFAARTPRQRAWLDAFLLALTRAGLADQVRWKISCRVDDLEPAILEKMMEHGLMAVYLGVESGSEQGLRTMNKHVSVAQNLAAIDLLKKHGVALAIGFMLFDPSSTVSTVRENLDFLRVVGEDGYFPINFCKMLPYAGTPIEAQLRIAGWLKGTLTQPDYDLLDPQLNWYAFLVQRIFANRNFSPQALVARLQQVDFDYHLAQAIGHIGLASNYKMALQQIIARANHLATETLETLLNAVIQHGVETLLHEQDLLLELTEHEWRGEAALEVELEALSKCVQPFLWKHVQ